MLLTVMGYCLLGAIAGLLAGMLGVGGGIIIVPMLVIGFGIQGLNPELIMHMALGTSLASIMFTSVSSAYSHHKRQGVDWSIVKFIAPGIILGTYTGAYFSAYISANFLKIFFSIFLFYVSIQMILNFKPKATRHVPGFVGLSFTGLLIGAISSLVGIGGGTLSVPFMVWCNLDMRRAIGTSSAIGLPIAIAGGVGYLLSGLGVENLPEYSMGFVYLPALVGIVAFSIFTAPYGAKLAHTLPIPRIKKFFALLLFAVGVNMLYSALG